MQLMIWNTSHCTLNLIQWNVSIVDTLGPQKMYLESNTEESVSIGTSDVDLRNMSINMGFRIMEVEL